MSLARHEDYGLLLTGVRVGPVTYASVRSAARPWWSGNRWLFAGSVIVAVGPLAGVEAGLADAPPRRAFWLRRRHPAVVIAIGESDDA